MDVKGFANELKQKYQLGLNDIGFEIYLEVHEDEVSLKEIYDYFYYLFQKYEQLKATSLAKLNSSLNNAALASMLTFDFNSNTLGFLIYPENTSKYLGVIVYMVDDKLFLKTTNDEALNLDKEIYRLILKIYSKFYQFRDFFTTYQNDIKAINANLNLKISPSELKIYGQNNDWSSPYFEANFGYIVKNHSKFLGTLYFKIASLPLWCQIDLQKLKERKKPVKKLVKKR